MVIRYLPVRTGDTMSELRNEIGKKRYDRIVKLLKEDIIHEFESEDIDYRQRDIDFAVNVFEEYWGDVIDETGPDNGNLDLLEDQLADDESHGNTGFILGIATARSNCPRGISKLTWQKIGEKYQ